MVSQFCPIADQKMLLQYDCGLGSVESSAVGSCGGVLSNSFVSRPLRFSMEDECSGKHVTEKPSFAVLWTIAMQRKGTENSPIVSDCL